MKTTTDQAKRPNPQPLEAASIPEALLTTTTACAVTGLSTATLYRLAAAGKLKPVKMGPRCTRWRASDVQAFIAAQS
jgi:excisionase family DNA binding protein